MKWQASKGHDPRIPDEPRKADVCPRFPTAIEVDGEPRKAVNPQIPNEPRKAEIAPRFPSMRSERIAFRSLAAAQLDSSLRSRIDQIQLAQFRRPISVNRLERQALGRPLPRYLVFPLEALRAKGVCTRAANRRTIIITPECSPPNRAQFGTKNPYSSTARACQFVAHVLCCVVEGRKTGESRSKRGIYMG